MSEIAEMEREFRARARKRIRMTIWIGHHHLFVEWLNGEISIFAA